MLAVTRREVDLGLYLDQFLIQASLLVSEVLIPMPVGKHTDTSYHYQHRTWIQICDPPFGPKAFDSCSYLVLITENPRSPAEASCSEHSV